MTREEITKSALRYLQGSWGHSDNYNTNEVSRDEAIKWKWEDQQPCGDCISRKAATDRFDLVQSDDKCMDYDDILAFLSSLPSVEPERKTGKWEYIQYDGNSKIGNWHCSNCRLIVNLGFEGKPYYHYCPSCGAKMEVANDIL